MALCIKIYPALFFALASIGLTASLSTALSYPDVRVFTFVRVKLGGTQRGPARGGENCLQGREPRWITAGAACSEAGSSQV